MGRHQTFKTEDAAFVLQDAIDAPDVIGRWEYDVQNDRACADAMVAMVFNVDPLLARSGTSIDVFLAGVHPEDRERTTRQFERHVQSGGCWVFEYRVCSADGVIRWIVDRGRITHDAEGRPIHGDGVLVDVTRMREEERSGDLEDATAARHPLERAAEHCLAFQRTIHELPEPLLQRMSDMMLIELGMALAKVASKPQRSPLN